MSSADDAALARTARGVELGGTVYVVDGGADQSRVYKRVAEGRVSAVLAGTNVSIIAYGQVCIPHSKFMKRRRAPVRRIRWGWAVV